MSTTDVVVSAADFAEARYRDDELNRVAFVLYANENIDEAELAVSEWDEIADLHEDNFKGVFRSFADFVYDTVNDMCYVPEQLESHIDWEGIGLEWEFWHTIIHDNRGDFIWESH